MKTRVLAVLICAAALIFTACTKNTDAGAAETAGVVTAARVETAALLEPLSPLETGTAGTETTTPETETDAVTDIETDTETVRETETETEPSVLSYGNACASPAFLRFLNDNYGGAGDVIKESISNGTFDGGLYYTLTGKSVYVLFDEYEGKTYKKLKEVSASDGGVIDLGFCGDIMFCDKKNAMERYVSYGGDINALIPADLIEIMKSYDVLLANNEFCVSERGEAQNKSFTFRGKPENLALYHQIGVDFVSTANNHIYDYGLDAFLDTLDALDEYGIDNAGAGRNISEASEPFIYVINGRKIAVLCGSRAEKNLKTPLADGDTAGVFGIYDDADMINAVKKASGECDFVIILAHWGEEFSTEVEDIIRVQGRRYIDAGADLIVGAHAHMLQGMEFYNGGLIAYNLGNFLFGNANVKTGILQIKIDANDMTFSASFVPCIQDRDHVWQCKGEEADKVLSFLRSVAPDVKIDGEGNITE